MEPCKGALPGGADKSVTVSHDAHILRPLRKCDGRVSQYWQSAKRGANMTKLAAVALAVLAFVGIANAQEAPTAPAWNDVLRTCSAEYRERADKIKGREVWQNFLNECKSRKGFIPKRDAAR